MWENLIGKNHLYKLLAGYFAKSWRKPKLVSGLAPRHGIRLPDFTTCIYPVMWIRIDHMRIRIHKILSIWIRDNKITKFIPNHCLNVNKKKIFLNLYLNLWDKLLLSFRLEKYNFLQKKPQNLSVKLGFSHNFLPLGPDPDPHHCIYHKT